MTASTHSITITEKVQDIGFRNTIEHMEGRLVCRGWFLMQKTREIKARGTESGAEIADIKEQTLSVYVELPDNFTKVSSDDEIDIGRKLDKANVLLKTGFEGLNTDLNTGFSTLTTIMSENNKEQRGHNTRLEAILKKLVEK